MGERDLASVYRRLFHQFPWELLQRLSLHSWWSLITDGYLFDDHLITGLILRVAGEEVKRDEPAFPDESNPGALVHHRPAADVYELFRRVPFRRTRQRKRFCHVFDDTVEPWM